MKRILMPIAALLAFGACARESDEADKTATQAVAVPDDRDAASVLFTEASIDEESYGPASFSSAIARHAPGSEEVAYPTAASLLARSVKPGSSKHFVLGCGDTAPSGEMRFVAFELASLNRGKRTVVETIVDRTACRKLTLAVKALTKDLQ